MADLYRQNTNSDKKNFQEHIKGPILLDAVLAKFKREGNPSILKDNFTSKTDPPIFTSTYLSY